MKWYKRLISKLDMYLIKKFLGTYFFSIALIISIAVVFDFNENIDKFTTNHAPWKGIIFEYYCQLRPLFFQLVQSAVRVHLSDILHLQTGREFGDYRHDGRRDELQAPDAPLYDFGCHHCSDDFPVGSLRHS